jgi:hypothetical protein
MGNGIGAAAQDLRVAVGELAVHLAECGDLSGADEGEVLGPEEVDLPFAFVILVSDALECALDVAADCCRQRVRGEFFSYSDHFSFSPMKLDLVRNFLLAAAARA